MKSTNYELQKRMEMLIAMKTNYCSKCGSERVEVQFNDLPVEAQKGFKMLMNLEPYRSGATFLFCKNCNEYSILSNPYL